MLSAHRCPVPTGVQCPRGGRRVRQGEQRAKSFLRELTILENAVKRKVSETSTDKAQSKEKEAGASGVSGRCQNFKAQAWAEKVTLKSPGRVRSWESWAEAAVGLEARTEAVLSWTRVGRS